MKPYSLLLSLLLIPPVSAQQGHRQHDAHVHGHAQLNLVVSGQMLQVELESPSNNLLVFEHQARSDKDKKTLQQALAVLNDPAQWLLPDAAASCQLQNIEIDSALLKPDHADGHQEHQKHAKHEDHDEHEKHAKNADHAEHEHDEHAAHSEFTVTLSFSCARPSRLKSVDVSGLFQRFRNMQEIDVQWISDTRQSATELSRDRGIIRLQ